jgi:signal transduction histidine kinase
MSRKKYVSIAIVVFVLVITYLHYSTLPNIYSFHDIYKEFYYIPIFLGALAFGLRGAILIYLAVFVFELPFVIEGWTGIFASEVIRLLHLGLQGMFAVFAGYLVQRERKAREGAEKEKDLARIGQVAAAIVHDLKNPLITILGFSKRIKDGKGNADEAVEIIMEAALTMQKIVHDVLDFSRPLQLTLKREDAGEVISGACKFCKAKAVGRGVTLSIEVPDSPLYAEVDRFHMERALVNLVSNAIEASDKGQSVSIGAAKSDNKLTIRIADHGKGMDGETLRNIFVPFYTRKKGGTGLGMPIAKKVAEAHGGAIYVESKPGEGTEVRIELPYRAAGQ